MAYINMPYARYQFSPLLIETGTLDRSSVVEHRDSLLARDTREIVEEVTKVVSCLEVVEEVLDGHASATKHDSPSSAVSTSTARNYCRSCSPKPARDVPRPGCAAGR